MFYTLCPLFSPAYAFTSLHYLKHKGIPLSSPLPLYFFLRSARLSSPLLILTLNFAQLSYLTTLLFLSHILSAMSLCSSHLVFPSLHPQLSTFFARLHFFSSIFSLVSSLSSFTYISLHPFLPPPPLLPSALLSPPQFTLWWLLSAFHLTWRQRAEYTCGFSASPV